MKEYPTITGLHTSSSVLHSVDIRPDVAQMIWKTSSNVPTVVNYEISGKSSQTSVDDGEIRMHYYLHTTFCMNT